jgi:poly-gamma-glutamate capsule biosynthesis protein CapA/YwtB (metallophosphatase superfamily)
MQDRLAAGHDRPGTVIATPESVTALVQAVANHADLVVACLHFGIRYCRPPTTRQRALAQAAVLAGADLVVGHHAHIWQPVEVFQDVPIFYGLGNFAFGSANRRADEALLIRAVLDGARIAGVEIFPIYTKNRDPDVNYQPKVLGDRAAFDLIHRLAVESADLGACVVHSGGRGVLSLPPAPGL